MKVIKWIGRVFLLGIFLGFLLVLYFLDDIVKSKIISGVSEASEGHYKIEIKSLDARVWTGAIKMDEVWLIPDPGHFYHKDPNDTTTSVPDIKFHLDTVSVSKIDWLRYLLDNKELEIGDVWISNPQLFVKSVVKDNSKIQQGNKDFFEFLPGIIAAFTGSLQIRSIAVRQGAMDVMLYTPSGISYRQTSKVDVLLNNIRIDTSSVKKALFTESAVFNLRNYKLISSDGLYNVSIGKIHGQINDSLLQIYDFKLNKKDTASKKFKDEFYVKIPVTESKGVNFAGLFRQKKIGFRKDGN